MIDEVNEASLIIEGIECVGLIDTVLGFQRLVKIFTLIICSH